MKSPFPGLDPYLEAFWGNVHSRMITYLSDQIQDCLPEGLWARVEESVAIKDAGDEKIKRVFPDVHVSEEQPWSQSGSAQIDGLAVAEPLVIAADEAPTQRHIEISDIGSGGAVVTAIEVLIPANKVGKASRRAYMEKQEDYLEGRINLVEIDLIRSGKYLLSAPYERLPPSVGSMEAPGDRRPDGDDRPRR